MEFDAGWFGMFAPAHTPAEIVSKLYGEIRTAVANPQVRERLLAQGLVPVGNPPEGFKAYVDAEIKAYAEMVRLAGIEPE
jgi:tripartite-type tricarboxylate transporter receptor subunit TctC